MSSAIGTAHRRSGTQLLYRRVQHKNSAYEGRQSENPSFERAAASAKEEQAQALRQELEAERFALEVRNRQFRETCLEMEESRRWYAELFDLAPVAYFVLSPRTEIIDVNKAGIHLLQSSK